MPNHRAYVCISSGFPKGVGFLGNPSYDALTVSTDLPLPRGQERIVGYFVPNNHWSEPLE